MKYLSEINAFYDWLETNTLADSDIVLWHALMHICNKAGWPRHFAAAVSVLQIKTGLKRDRIYDSRNRLRDAGRLRWDSRKGNQSAIYELVPFVSDTATQIPTQTPSQAIVSAIATQLPTQLPTQSPTQLPTQSPTINRLEKRIPEKTDDDFSRVVKAVSDVMGRVILSPFEAEQIGMWLAEHTVELVLEAVKQAGLNGANRPIKYIDTMLFDWKKRGIKNIEEAAAPTIKATKKANSKNWRDLLSPKREEM